MDEDLPIEVRRIGVFETTDGLCWKGILMGLAEQKMTSEEIARYCDERGLGSRNIAFRNKKELESEELIEMTKKHIDGKIIRPYQLTEKGRLELEKIELINGIIEFEINQYESDSATVAVGSGPKESPRLIGLVTTFNTTLQKGLGELLQWQDGKFVMDQKVLQVLPNIILLMLIYAMQKKPIPELNEPDPEVHLKFIREFTRDWEKMVVGSWVPPS